LYLQSSISRPRHLSFKHQYDHFITSERGLISLSEVDFDRASILSYLHRRKPHRLRRNTHTTLETIITPHLSPAIATSIHRTMLSNAGASNRMPGHQEYRHMSTGSLNIPPGGLNGSINGPPPHMGATTRFDGPRSPPGKQS
jgi:hypothetical protein